MSRRPCAFKARPAWRPRSWRWNDTFGAVFEVSQAEAATPAMAQERANALKDQFIMDLHTAFSA